MYNNSNSWKIFTFVTSATLLSIVGLKACLRNTSNEKTSNNPMTALVKPVLIAEKVNLVPQRLEKNEKEITATSKTLLTLASTPIPLTPQEVFEQKVQDKYGIALQDMPCALFAHLKTLNEFGMSIEKVSNFFENYREGDKISEEALQQLSTFLTDITPLSEQILKLDINNRSINAQRLNDILEFSDKLFNNLDSTENYSPKDIEKINLLAASVRSSLAEIKYDYVKNIYTDIYKMKYGNNEVESLREANDTNRALARLMQISIMREKLKDFEQSLDAKDQTQRNMFYSQNFFAYVNYDRYDVSSRNPQQQNNEENTLVIESFAKSDHEPLYVIFDKSDEIAIDTVTVGFNQLGPDIKLDCLQRQ